MQATSGISGKQPGDPVRACAAIIQTVEDEIRPRHLVLGAFGVETVCGKLAGVVENQCLEGDQPRRGLSRE